MKALCYLQEISKIDARINTEFEELEVLETLAARTTTTISESKVQTFSKSDRVANYAEKIMEKKEQIKENILKLMDVKKEAQQLLEKCDADCITLLYKRYFKCEGWEKIAFEMNFTYQWVSGGLHRKALSQFQKALETVEKE